MKNKVTKENVKREVLDNNPLPGQYSIFDYPEYLPENNKQEEK